MIARGSVHWVDLGERRGSAPAHRRPVLVVQADALDTSRLDTTLAVVINSNTALAATPGNVFLPTAATGLPRDSVANVTALVTVNKVYWKDRRVPFPATSWTRSTEASAESSNCSRVLEL